MAITKCLDATQCTDQVTLCGLFADREQRVRRSTKRRHDDYWIAIELPPNDLRCTSYRGCIANGSATEFEDDHALPSLPVAARSSAFRTEPPAAPRIVLWPRATMRMSRIGSGRTRPTVTVIPAPAFTSRRGCGRLGSSVTTSGCSGRLGRFHVASLPRHSRSTRVASSGLTRELNDAVMHTV